MSEKGQNEDSRKALVNDEVTRSAAGNETSRRARQSYKLRSSLYNSFAASKSASSSREPRRSRKSSMRRARRSNAADSTSRFVSTMSRHVPYGLPANRKVSRRPGPANVIGSPFSSRR